MIYLYCLGAYFRLADVRISMVKSVLMVIAGYFLCCVASVVIFILREGHEFLLGRELVFFTLNSPFVIASGVGLFFIAKGLKIGFSPVINGIASTTFGIYLIHNSIFVKTSLQLLTENIVQLSPWWGVIPIMVIGVVIVMGVCGLCDTLRQRFCEAPVFMFYDKYLDCHGKKIDKVLDHKRWNSAFVLKLIANIQK